MAVRKGKAIATLDVRSRAEWRAWLRGHHDSVAEIWLVFHKRHTRKKSVPYEDAIEEALCFGWVDSLVRRLDERRYARKFTPRRPDSRWSKINLRRYAAWATFERLAPSYRRDSVGWLDTGKKAATNQTRLREAIELLAAGAKLGLK
jgi:uncharacterized protein YdeI (YjbR/CyaY-like superfamily)